MIPKPRKRPNERDEELAGQLCVALGLSSKSESLETFDMDTAARAFAAYRVEVAREARKELCEFALTYQRAGGTVAYLRKVLAL